MERLREGRSYTTRSVKAVQDGQVVFILLCSFQRPEPWQPGHQWQMPANVPSPEECELEEIRFIRTANEPGLHEKFKAILLEVASVSFHRTRDDGCVDRLRPIGTIPEPYKSEGCKGARRV